VTVWVCKPLTVEAGKRWPQPIEQRVEKGWTTSGQPVQTKTKKDNGKTKKDTGKWCEFHKSPWHNTVECCSKKSLVAEVKAFESDAGSDSESELEKGRQIIDAEPSAIVSTTTKVQPDEPDEPEEGECLFHSQMWVKGTPFHFIIDSGSQKNLISVEVIKWLALPTTPHPQPYTIGWLCQGSDLHVSQQCPGL
jgi:hypothetical protein